MAEEWSWIKIGGVHWAWRAGRNFGEGISAGISSDAAPIAAVIVAAAVFEPLLGWLR